VSNLHHEMKLEKTHPSGAQVWFCPLCERMLLIQWHPKFDMIELKAGDGNASHFGSTSDDLRIGPPQIREEEAPEISAELRAALEEALEDVDFDDWLGIAD